MLNAAGGELLARRGRRRFGGEFIETRDILGRNISKVDDGALEIIEAGGGLLNILKNRDEA